MAHRELRGQRPRRLDRRTGPALLLALLLSAAAARGQPRLSLEEASMRTGANLRPLHENEEAVVEGVISAKIRGRTRLLFAAIQDDTHHGLALTGDAAELERLTPGQRVEARGRIEVESGQLVLKATQLRNLGAVPAPMPLKVGLAQTLGLRYVSVLVSIEERVTFVDPNAGASAVVIGDGDRFLRVFIPEQPWRGAGTVPAGAAVRVTGVLVQYSRPGEREPGLYLMLASPEGLEVVESRGFLPPPLLVSALAATVLLLAIWWVREQRMSRLRRAMKLLHSLSEDVIAAASSADIVERLESSMPSLTGADQVRAFLFNNRTRSLERMASPSDPETAAIALDSASEGLAAGVAAAFRNRSLLAISDTRRSPIFKGGPRAALPRAALFVPMFAHSELLGVLELSCTDRMHQFTQEEQAAAQHIANQVGAAVRLQEQQLIREQLFRSEKLAATGQLISDLATELKQPLESITHLSDKLARQPALAGEPAVPALGASARRASEIVARLTSFAGDKGAESRSIELNRLLVQLLDYRAEARTENGIRLERKLSPDSIYVHGSPGQLEQIFLNLLVHAEQCAAAAGPLNGRTLAVSTSLIARRVLIEIRFRAEPDVANPLDGGRTPDSAGGLAVCRGIVQSHGGDVKFSRQGRLAAFSVELPVERTRAWAAPEGPRRPRAFTFLVVEPDNGAQRQLVTLLAARGHRAVPISSGEEAAELVQRLRFDAVFYGIRPSSPAWMELFERIRAHASTIVVSESFEAHAGSPDRNLSKPVRESDLDQLIDSLAGQESGK